MSKRALLTRSNGWLLGAFQSRIPPDHERHVGVFGRS
jgi:hypothetical protein